MCISENNCTVREQILAMLITIQPNYLSIDKESHAKFK